MNKFVKRLVESLFDSDEDTDIFNDDDGIIGDLLAKKLLEESTEIVANHVFDDNNAWFTFDQVDDKTVYSEIYNESICFYYNSRKKNIYGMVNDTPTKKYVNKISFIDLKEALRFIDIFDLYGIKYVAMEIEILGDRYKSFTLPLNVVLLNKIDFHNIQFATYYIGGVSPVNITCDLNAIYDNTLYFLKISPNESHNFGINFYNCYINQDNINILDTTNIILSKVYNMRDFSFIKHINNVFDFSCENPEHLPETCNYTGLPDGNYNVKIKYDTDGVHPSFSKVYSTSKHIMNLIGLPKRAKEIKINVNAAPLFFLLNFSFEGLTMDMLDKFEFKERGFPGKTESLILQIGPYKLTSKWRRWEPTLPQYKTIIQTLDWFLDCYLKSNGPNKEYVAPNNDEVNKILLKELKKIDAINLKEQDRQEDMLKMITLLKLNVKPKSIYHSYSSLLMIIKMADTYITFCIMGKYRSQNYTMTYDKFIGWLSKSYYRVSKDENSLLLTDTIIKPVLEEREKIKALRKEEAKLLRKLEKELEKKSKVTIRKRKDNDNDDIDKEEPIIDDVEKEENIVDPDLNINNKTNSSDSKVNSSNIHVIDYSDKAIAIYGNTYDIKLLLKDLGCKYNKFLTIDGKKQPGWIVGKRKKSEVELIINNL